MTRGPATLRITATNPYDMACVVRTGGARFDLEDQPSAVAWAEFDTTEVHYNQAYGAGPAHDPAEMPRSVVRRREALADWIPAQRELFATSGTQSHGGSYVTVAVTGPRDRQVRTATAMAMAALRDGPPEPVIVPPA